MTKKSCSKGSNQTLGIERTLCGHLRNRMQKDQRVLSCINFLNYDRGQDGSHDGRKKEDQALASQEKRIFFSSVLEMKEVAGSSSIS